MRTHCSIVGIVALSLGLGVMVAHAEDEKPDARLSLHGTSAAIGIGGTWGSGTLTYRGKKHTVRIRGLEIGGVGGATIDATGSVYHLKKLADFDGTYGAVGAAAAAGPAGAGGSVMRNEKGVVIHLTSERQGVELKAGVDGVKLELAHKGD